MGKGELKMYSLKDVLKRFSPFFKDYIPYFILAIVGMGLSSGGTAFTAWLVQPLLDKIFIAKDKEIRVPPNLPVSFRLYSDRVSEGNLFPKAVTIKAVRRDTRPPPIINIQASGPAASAVFLGIASIPRAMVALTISRIVCLKLICSLCIAKPWCRNGVY